jgi:hypothetical protein
MVDMLLILNGEFHIFGTGLPAVVVPICSVFPVNGAACGATQQGG